MTEHDGLRRVGDALDKLRANVATFRLPISSTSNGTAEEGPTAVHDPHGSVSELLRSRHRITAALFAEPYSVVLYGERAWTYYTLNYPDLAASDAYRMLLLLDELDDDSGDYHERVVQQWDRDAGEHLGHNIDCNGDYGAALLPREVCYLHAYCALCHALLDLGCFKSACEFADRFSRTFPELDARYGLRESTMRASKHGIGESSSSVETELPDAGWARREIYPWTVPGEITATHEENDGVWTQDPDRYSEKALSVMNAELGSVAPGLEVKVVELPTLRSSIDDRRGRPKRTITQLGVFAKRDLHEDEVVLDERSLLTASSKPHAPFCEACGVPLPDVAISSPSTEELERAQSVVECPDCADVLYCSETCLEAAKESYHPATCGADVESICKDVQGKQASDALYTLLVLRAFAMAQTQDVHPLDLLSVRYIWGDFTNVTPDAPVAKTLPFSFRFNVLEPLHMLEKMDIDPFVSLDRFDTWTVNTLLAKFRGTASAKPDLHGRPEIAAVHPWWCLANHSCSPNVRWDWSGSIKFTVRRRDEDTLPPGRPDEAGPDEPGRRRRLPSENGGIAIKKGEEILSHYCDVDLPVRERREWMLGALGGICACERCVNEEREEEGGETNGEPSPHSHADGNGSGT